MAGFTVTQTQDDGRPRRGLVTSSSIALSLSGDPRQRVAIRIPDFTVLFSHALYQVCDLALHKMGPGAGLPRNCTVISTVGTQPHWVLRRKAAASCPQTLKDRLDGYRRHHILHVGNKLTGVGGLLISKELCAAHDARIDRVVNLQHVVSARRWSRRAAHLAASLCWWGLSNDRDRCRLRWPQSLDCLLIQTCGRELSAFAWPKISTSTSASPSWWLEIKRVNREWIGIV